MSGIRVEIHASSESAVVPLSSMARADASSLERIEGINGRALGSMPASQSYYWTRLWQVGETESLAELEQGRYRRFANGRDAVRWLLAADDD